MSDYPSGPTTPPEPGRTGESHGSFDWQTRPEHPPRARPSGGFTAAIVLVALVVGALSGLAAAVGFVAWDSSGSDEPATTTVVRSGDGAESSVVDREDATTQPGSVADVAASVLPSVVQINVRGEQQQGSGSGVIISTDGEILTNNHVVELAGEDGLIVVSFDNGDTAEAEILGSDPLTDLAVIKTENADGLTPATLGQSEDLDVGEQVVAIGSPFGLEATVTSGIVSALGRPVSVATGLPDGGPLPGPGFEPEQAQAPESTTYPAIQTDASINPGNSGGPLVNMNGEVVGINSSIRTASSSSDGTGSIGLGFAIPLGQVLPIVEQLRNGETATHAQLGVSVTAATGENGLLTGARVEEVNDGSAAEEAGLEEGDVVTKVGNQLINDSAALVATIRGYRPDDTVTLTVVRTGEAEQIEVTLDSDQGNPAS